MHLMMFFFITPIIIPSLLILISWILKETYDENSEKNSPYECGFDPMCCPRTTITVRFYLMAIIFLIFDVEIALIFPLVLTKGSSNMIYWTITMIMFMTILILGLYYEWEEGTFQWS